MSVEALVPIVRFESEDVPAGVVWWSRLDGRYLVEVRRLSDYQGLFVVFDHKDNDRVIDREEVGLSYEAAYGPDVADVDFWREKAAEVVDGIGG
ncbi:MAG: hypothetical protein WAN50_04930 [Minisyncoccia bacterium]